MLSFDELISNGELTKAARLFAKEYYDSGKMGHTRKLLIEVLADKCDKYDEAIARQSVKSEEVQEAIDELMYGSWQSSKDGYPITLGDKTIGLAIAALQEYRAWISVEDRLPEDRRAVLVWEPMYENIFTMYWEEGQWFFFGGGGKANLDYTHWKPLPEAPKGETP